MAVMHGPNMSSRAFPYGRRFVFTCLILICSPLTSAANEAFTSLTIEQAQAKAKAENKIVFVDFYTTWCGPCRMLDQTTWKDKQVIAWLSAKTIPLKIDADQLPEVAEKYAVAGYPTLLFLKPDGTEIDRIVGFLPANDFLEAANGILSGKSAIVRSKEKLERRGKNDPMARLEYARTLQQNGQNEEALEEYLWCFDEGLKYSMSFAGVRLSFLLNDIAELGQTYPPALEALRERRDAAQKLIVSGKDTQLRVMEFTSLNEYLGTPQQSLALYDQLRKERPKSASVVYMRESLMDMLLEQHRYAEIIEGIDLKEKIDQIFDMYKPSWITSLLLLKYPKEQKEQFKEAQNQIRVRQVGRYYQVLIGLKRLDEADALAKRLLKSQASANTYNELAWNGYLTGAPIEANLNQARKAHEMTEGKDASIVDTLARILHAQGRQREAIKLVRRSLKQTASPQDRQKLEICLASIGGNADQSWWSYGAAGAGLAVFAGLIGWITKRRNRIAHHPDAASDSLV